MTAMIGSECGDQSDGSIDQGKMQDKDHDQDVTAHSIGVELTEGCMTTIIPKNTKIPVKVRNEYVTRFDNQSGFGFPIYQGEDPKTVNNRFRGFISVGIPPGPAGKYSAWMTMEVDQMGFLRVEAGCDGSGDLSSLVIPGQKKRINEDSEETETIERLMFDKDAFKFSFC